MKTEPSFRATVTRRIEAADGVIIVDFAPVDGGAVAPWEAGAHIDVMANDDQQRQYSLCGDVADTSGYRIAVLREDDGQGFSKLLHQTATVGTEWTIRGPRNNFDFVDAEEYLFIAGGIGITPLLPMIAVAQERGADWKLLYGGRTRSSMAFLDDLGRYDTERVRIAPQDEVGLLPLAEWLGEPRTNVAIYSCGPETLLAALEDIATQWPSRTLHVERFTAKEFGDFALDGPFEVELKQSGVTLTVPPEKTILQMVAEAGIPTLSACQEGTCGTCETAVIEGIPEHRDSVLDEDERAENDYMMICCSRSCTPKLVLDI